MNAWGIYWVAIWVYSYAGWALEIIPLYCTYFSFFFSCFFLEAVILPISSQLLLDFISKHLGTYSFNSHLSEEMIFSAPFQQMNKNHSVKLNIFPKVTELVSSRMNEKCPGPKAYLVSSGRTLCVQCRGLGFNLWLGNRSYVVGPGQNKCTKRKKRRKWASKFSLKNVSP